jgi:hypothetical protein
MRSAWLAASLLSIEAASSECFAGEAGEAAEFRACSRVATASCSLSCLGFIGCGPFGVVAFIFVVALSLKRKATVTNAVTVTACHWIRVITRCAETGLVPPANGVMFNAVELPAGLRTVSTESTFVVCTKAIPTIWLVPVARPTTV